MKIYPKIMLYSSANIANNVIELLQISFPLMTHANCSPLCNNRVSQLCQNEIRNEVGSYT